MQNTLNLVGDGDDIDVLSDVERLFGIAVTDAEAANLLTVGNLFDLIMRKKGAHRTRACLTQVAFYRLRRALRELGADVQIEPDSPLSSVLEAATRRSSVRAAWRDLSRRSRLKLPNRELNWGWLHLLLGPSAPLWWIRLRVPLIVVIFVAAVFALERLTAISGQAAFWSALLGIIFMGVALSVILPLVFGTIPIRLQTVGDLAREAAGCSFVKLRTEKNGSSAQDQWLALTSILREHTAHTGQIDRNTTFFARAGGAQVTT